MSKELALTVELMGGLGNQMFQYAAARGFAEKNNLKLQLDTFSGFVRDKVYKREYELDSFPIHAELAGLSWTLPFWLERLKKKLKIGKTLVPFDSRWFGNIISEPVVNKFNPEILNFNIKRNSWFRGYWQSEKYFANVTDELSRELMPPPSKNKQFIDMAELMSSCNSVAVCIRLYEEVPGSYQYVVGGVASIDFYNEAMVSLSEQFDDVKFFCFCTHESEQLKQLDFPNQMYPVYHDNGYEGTLDRLWLLSCCKNHIISNSSFYWWGAWLAEKKYTSTQVIASDNFINKDCIPSRWRVLKGLD